jgi:hypothetical protein
VIQPSGLATSCTTFQRFPRHYFGEYDSVPCTKFWRDFAPKLVQKTTTS